MAKRLTAPVVMGTARNSLTRMIEAAVTNRVLESPCSVVVIAATPSRIERYGIPRASAPASCCSWPPRTEPGVRASQSRSSALRHRRAARRVVVERIARGDDAERTPVLDDGHVTKTAAVHHPQRLHEGLVGMHRLRVRRHRRRAASFPDCVARRSRINASRSVNIPMRRVPSTTSSAPSLVLHQAHGEPSRLIAVTGGCPAMMERSDRSGISASPCGRTNVRIERYAPRQSQACALLSLARDHPVRNLHAPAALRPGSAPDRLPCYRLHVMGRSQIPTRIGRT
jgi:hypothetical protein